MVIARVLKIPLKNKEWKIQKLRDIGQRWGETEVGGKEIEKYCSNGAQNFLWRLIVLETDAYAIFNSDPIWDNHMKTKLHNTNINDWNVRQGTVIFSTDSSA